MNTSTRQSGYVALLAVLVTGAAALAIGLALLTTGTDGQRSALAEQQARQARALAVTCAQEALQLMHDNIAFSGTNTVPLGQGSCVYVVAVVTGTTRTISSTATVGNVVRKIMVYVTINLTNISITSWQEVS